MKQKVVIEPENTSVSQFVPNHVIIVKSTDQLKTVDHMDIAETILSLGGGEERLAMSTANTLKRKIDCQVEVSAPTRSVSNNLMLEEEMDDGTQASTFENHSMAPGTSLIQNNTHNTRFNEPEIEDVGPSMTQHQFSARPFVCNFFSPALEADNVSSCTSGVPSHQPRHAIPVGLAIGHGKPQMTHTKFDDYTSKKSMNMSIVRHIDLILDQSDSMN